MPCYKKLRSKVSKRHRKQDWRIIDNMKDMEGGSPASDLVMADTVKNPILMDHVVSPRIRQDQYDDGFPNPMCGGYDKRIIADLSNNMKVDMKGGSLASDMVMSNLSQNSQTKNYLSENKVQANMASLNLYQTTGGGKKLSGGSRKRSQKKFTKNKRSLKRKQKRTGKTLKRNNLKGGSNCSRMNRQTGGSNYSKKQMGGGSDWIMSNYSQGNINAPQQPLSWTNQFSQSQPSGRDMLMNPPTLGLAGSGYPMGSLEGANVRMTGAPLS